ncbi:hypothetical protein PODOV028v1_30001, partial [Vibrio phage PS32B.3]
MTTKVNNRMIDTDVANMTDYGAVEGGDLSPILNYMLAQGLKHINVDVESGTFGSKIDDMENVTLSGLGMGRTLLTRTFDGLLFDLGNYCELRNMQITGGVALIAKVLTGTAGLFIDRCRLIPDGGYAAVAMESDTVSTYFANSIFGSGDTRVGGLAMVTGATDGNGVRHITDCSGAGNPLADLTGMDDVFITGGFSTNGLIFDDTTSKIFINNMRWGVSTSNPITRLEIRGENISIDNEVGLPLDLYCSSSQISTVTPGGYDINDYGSGNMVEVRARAYTPVLTGSGGITPSLGSGSLNGIYSRAGNKITVNLELIWAADSVLGNGQFIFSLPDSMPVVQNLGLQQYSGTGIVRSSTNLLVNARFNNNTRTFTLEGVDNSGNRVDVGVSTP